MKTLKPRHANPITGEGYSGMAGIKPVSLWKTSVIQRNTYKDCPNFHWLFSWSHNLTSVPNINNIQSLYHEAYQRFLQDDLSFFLMNSEKRLSLAKQFIVSYQNLIDNDFNSRMSPFIVPLKQKLFFISFEQPEH